MLAFIKTLVRDSSRKTTEAEPTAPRALSPQETEIVSGGINPQPLPPAPPRNSLKI